MTKYIITLLVFFFTLTYFEGRISIQEEFCLYETKEQLEVYFFYNQELKSTLLDKKSNDEIRDKIDYLTINVNAAPKDYISLLPKIELLNYEIVDNEIYLFFEEPFNTNLQALEQLKKTIGYQTIYLLYQK